MHAFFQWWVTRPEHIDDRPYIKEACLYAWEAGYEAAMKIAIDEIEKVRMESEDEYFKGRPRTE